MLGKPVDLRVVGEHRLAELAGADKPAGAGVLDQRVVVSPPAEGIVVEVLLLMHQEPAVAEITADVAVAFLHESTTHGRELICEGSVRSDAVEQGWHFALEPLAFGEKHAIVDLAKGGGNMDDTRARVGRHEVSRDHPPGDRFTAAACRRGHRWRSSRSVAVKWGQVRAANKGCAGERLDDFEFSLFLLGQSGGEGFGQNIFSLGLISKVNGNVGEISLHGCKLVGRQRPGRRCPGDQAAAAGLAGFIKQRKGDVDAGVGHLSIALTNLATGEGGATLRPPPDDLVALVEQPAVE